MIVTVPAAIPVTMPEVAPIVATAGLLLPHVPPASISPRVMVLPVHTFEGPVMGAVYG